MLKATVAAVVTCKKLLPGNPSVDVVKLRYMGLGYYISTEVGRLKHGQEVKVVAHGRYKGYGRYKGTPKRLSLAE